MKKYRRIEINAFRRRVTVVSGEWRPGDVFDASPAQTDDEVSLNDADECEPVAPDSPEGQLILVEAVRSLERRLLPAARAMICARESTFTQNGFYLKLRSFYESICPKTFRLIKRRNETRPQYTVKQSVKD